MKNLRFSSHVIISLLLCSILLICLQGEVAAKQKSIGSAENPEAELFAIDVALSSRQVLDDLGIIYQDQPRLGYWRAAATIEQLYALQERRVGFTYAGQVAIVKGGENQPNRSSATGFCNGVNGTNFNIPINTDWIYDPIWTSCPGASTATVSYIDIYYDVIHPWADTALWLNVGSNTPSWSYLNIEVKEGSCLASATPDWHKYVYNITHFNGRPVNQRWDLAASDGCLGSGGPSGYIDYWSIWIYYASTTPLVDPSYIGSDITISQNWSGEYRPSIAYNSQHQEYLVVWENMWGAGGYHDIYAQRISATGKLLSWFSVSTDTTKNKFEPSVAYDPIFDRYLVVWVQDYYGDGSDMDILGRYIPWNGPEISLSDFSIVGWYSDQYHPVVAYGLSQQSYMVAWRSSDDGIPGYISARSVSPDLALVGQSFQVSSGTEECDFPEIAYNLARNEYLVVWDVDMSGSGTDFDIYGRRLQGNGTPISDEFSIAGWSSEEQFPTVAACHLSDQYMVAWQSDQSTGLDQHAIYARYLNGDAKLGAVNLMENFSNDEKHVDVSCNATGNQYLLVWQYQYFGSDYGIWGAIAYPNGLISAPFEITYPGLVYDREFPAIGGGKSSYLVAWEHQRDGDFNLDIHGRLLRYASFLPITIR